MSKVPMERRDIIATRLAQGHNAVATELALEFDVSEDAIRRDLRSLAAQGRCRRVYGGALPVSPASASMEVRRDQARERKDALARMGATLVRPRAVVFLDNGSANLALVKFLPDDGLTVATNSIAIAAEVLKRPDLRLIMVGGSVDPHVGGCVDAHAVEMVAQMVFDHCFVGACALSAAGGVFAFNLADSMFKKAVLKSGAHKVVLALSEKLETRAPYRVGAIGDIDHVVVEAEAPDHPIHLLSQAGTTVLRAAPPR